MLKIAFLFLTINNVHHEPIWRDFFEGHDDCYSLYVHAKETVSDSSWFKRHEMKKKVSTTWANTMRAQIAMLEEALKDPNNEKFVFLSETTIPLLDFDAIYTQLLKTPESIFFFEPSNHVNRNGDFYPNEKRNLKPIPTHRQFKNAQWIILNREHAQMMVADRKYIDIISAYPHDQEHYPATFLLNNGCFEQIIGNDMTYVDWKKGPKLPHVFADLSDQSERDMVTKAIAQGYLFARKFAPTCEVRHLDSLLAWRAKRKPAQPAPVAKPAPRKPVVFEDMKTAMLKYNLA